MPTGNGSGNFLQKSKPPIVIVIISLFLLSALLYFFIYNRNLKNFIQTNNIKNGDLSESPNSGDELPPKIKKAFQYPEDANLPDFIVRTGLEVPPERNLNYESFEYVAVRVVSTGEVSDVEIRNASGDVIAYAIQLKVLIDSDQGDINNQEPIFLALKVFPEPNTVGNISPVDLFKIAIYKEKQRLLNELDPSQQDDPQSYDEISDKLEVYMDEVLPRTYERDFLKELFNEGSVLIFVPYVNSDDYLRGYKNGSLYLNLLKEYYGFNGSDVLEKILADDLKNINAPILALHVFHYTEVD